MAALALAAALLLALYAATLPSRHLLEEIAASAIFAASYLVIAIGRMPGFRLDRPGAALVGASLMVALGILPLEEAFRAIDFDTIALLLGMMILVANLRLSGFFRLAGGWAVRRARHPLLLLAAIILLAGLLSAFLVNDTVCLVLTPLVLELVTRLGRRPQPYLLAVAMASNVGSTATITGNPQNMIIGSLSHIAYVSFAASLAPVAAIGLLLTFALLAIMFGNEFWTRTRLASVSAGALAAGPDPAPARSRAFMRISVLVAAAMVAGFFAGFPPAGVAIAAGALLLVAGRAESSQVLAQVDWPLLAMFAGLFIVVAGLEERVISVHTATVIGELRLDRVPVLTAVTAALSNLVSNVPAVLVLRPFVAGLADPRRAWLVLAMASTLAGNLTLVGSIANLIVARSAEAHGVRIGFWTYLKVGAPLSLLTLLAGILWL
ncbi:MAG TPA: anion transporter [Steroidobacteraceae bacterium]|nr:anion transporter [Steroidobacteraceae bacterium]